VLALALGADLADLGATERPWMELPGGVVTSIRVGGYELPALAFAGLHADRALSRAFARVRP